MVTARARPDSFETPKTPNNNRFSLVTAWSAMNVESRPLSACAEAWARAAASSMMRVRSAFCQS
eukprot:7227052-Heterocapsa_arctica.AAC.1